MDPRVVAPRHVLSDGELKVLHLDNKRRLERLREKAKCKRRYIMPGHRDERDDKNKANGDAKEDAGV